MERVWLKSYPAGVPAEVDPQTFRSLAEFLAASVAKYRRRTAFISMGRAMTLRANSTGFPAISPAICKTSCACGAARASR